MHVPTYNIVQFIVYKSAVKSAVLFLFMLTTGLLSGCSFKTTVQDDLQNYEDRLQSFTQINIAQLEVDASADNQSIQLFAPEKASMLMPITSIDINLREFYAFKQCSLNTLIAQRNTALGKMHLPSSRLVYETQLLAAFDECISIMRKQDNTELATKLTQWQAQKQAQFPSVWANFITQSNELFLHLTHSGDFISGNADDNFVATKQAFRFLSNIGTKQAIDDSALEQHLQTLEHTRLLAKMWRTQQLLNKRLNEISPILQAYLQLNTCSNATQANDIVIMRNIFTLFFVKQIQPLGGELNKYHYQLQPLLESITSKYALPQAFVDYIDTHLGEQHEQYKTAMQQHITLWQQIFARCE